MVGRRERGRRSAADVGVVRHAGGRPGGGRVRTLVAGRPRVELTTAALGAALLAVYTPVLRALVAVWTDVPYYSYGFLVPVFSAYVAWDAREELARRPLTPARSGLAVLAAGLALLVSGLRVGSL